MSRKKKTAAPTASEQMPLSPPVSAPADDERVRALESEVEDLRTRVADLEGDLVIKEGEIEDLETEAERLKGEIAELVNVDEDPEGIAVAMHAEVESDYFHGRDFDYKHRMIQMGQAAIDKLRPRAG